MAEPGDGNSVLPTGPGAEQGLPAWDPRANASRVVFDPAQLEQEFRAGKVNLVADHSYPMVRENGEVHLVGGRDAQRALADGFHFARAEDVARAEAGSAAGMLRTAADGVLDGATFGLGGAGQALTGADRLDLAARREVNPWLHGASALVGGAASALLLGGASLGAVAEAGAARAIGAEAAATTLGRMAVSGTGAAAEGAAFGVGDQVTEAVLGDAPLAAESLIAAGAHGAAWGGVAGALLGRVLGRGKPYELGPGNRPVAKGERVVLDAAESDALRRQIRTVRPTAAEVNAAAEKQLGERPPDGYGQLVLDMLDRHAAGQFEAQGAHDLAKVFRGSAAERRAFIEAAQTPESVIQEQTRSLKAALEARIGTDNGMRAAFELEEQALQAKLAKLEADAEVARLKLDDADLKGVPRKVAERDARAARDEAAAAVAELKSGRASADARGQQVAELRRHFGIDAEGRVDEGKLSSFVNSVSRPNADERVAALRAFAGDDPKLVGLIDDLSKRQAARNLLRDQLAREQAGGMDLELLAGVAGHGVAGFPGAIVAREVAQHFARPARSGLSRYRIAAQVQRVHGSVRESLDRFVAGAKSGTRRAQEVGRSVDLDRRLAPTTLVLLTGNRDDRRKAAAARIAELSALDATTLSAQLEGSTADHDELTPDVASVMRTRLAEAHAFLLSVLPQPVGSSGAGGGLVPNGQAALRMIPDRDIRRFAEVDAAIQDPLRIVDQLADGKVPDPAAKLAVETVYPSFWAYVTRTYAEALAANPDAVGWKQAQAAAVALGLNSHPAFESEALTLRQNLLKAAGSAKPKPGPVHRGLARAQDRALSGSAATVLDGITDRRSSKRF